MRDPHRWELVESQRAERGVHGARGVHPIFFPEEEHEKLTAREAETN
jgi:hypothetical protein